MKLILTYDEEEIQEYDLYLDEYQIIINDLKNSDKLKLLDKLGFLSEIIFMAYVIKEITLIIL